MEKDDNVVVDCGFRNVLPDLEAFGPKTNMPSYLIPGEPSMEIYKPTLIGLLPNLDGWRSLIMDD